VQSRVHNVGVAEAAGATRTQNGVTCLQREHAERRGGHRSNPATGRWSEKWSSAYRESENGLLVNIRKRDAMRRLCVVGVGLVCVYIEKGEAVVLEREAGYSTGGRRA